MSYTEHDVHTVCWTISYGGDKTYPGYKHLEKQLVSVGTESVILPVFLMPRFSHLAPLTRVALDVHMCVGVLTSLFYTAISLFHMEINDLLALHCTHSHI